MVSDSSFLGELVGKQQWDEIGRLANSHLVRISLEEPNAWPAAFAALPPGWLRQNPRLIILRAILESLEKPFTVMANNDYEAFVAWLDQQDEPLARDEIGRHLGPMQYARALGHLGDADNAAECILRAIWNAAEYTNFDDFLPSIYIPVGATKLLIGDTASAIAIFTEAIRWCVIGRGHPAAPHARNYLAFAYALDGDYAQAHRSATADVGLRTSAAGSFAHAYESAAILVPPLLALGALDEQASATAIARIDPLVDETEFWSVAAHARARHALYWGDQVAASETLERLLVSHRSLSGPGSLAGAILRSDLSDLYQSMGSLDAAERALGPAEQQPCHPMVSTSRLRLHALRGNHEAVLDGIHALVERGGSGVLPMAAWAVMRANSAQAAFNQTHAEEYSQQAATLIARYGAFDALTEATPEVLGRITALLGEERPLARPPYRVAEAPVLTKQELKVLQSLRGKASLKKISSDLYLSVNTVKTHRRNLYRKLGAQSRDEALQAGRELRLLL